MSNTHWRLVPVAAVVVVSLGFVARAVADDPDRFVHNLREAVDAGTSGANQANAADRAFLVSATRDGLAAIALGKLAERQAESAGVRWYGRRLVGDHQRMNVQLAELAERYGVTLPDPDRTHREMGSLPQLKREEFDQAFLRHLVGFNQRLTEKLNS